MIASWKDLRKGACGLPAEGDNGFEGLIRALFEAEIGERFFISRRGDQPVGDVYSPTASTAIQCKRYDKGRLRENEIEGDIDRILREAPGVELVVVATTRDSAQLATRLSSKARETGVDMLFLPMGDILTGFGALCVRHWGVVERFLGPFAPASTAWASSEAAQSVTQAALARLRSELEGLGTWQVLREEAASALRRRVRTSGEGTFHNPIDLGSAVVRPSLQTALKQWWSSPSSGLAVLEGDEGTGKTWVAAAFAECPDGDDPTLALWLDSASWAEARTILGVVEVGLGTVFPPADPRIARFKHKAFLRWQRPILVILDGANEFEAWEAARRLLADYALHGAHLLPRIRLLFTSRHLDRRPGFGKCFWATCHRIAVGPFNEEEFRTALRRLSPPLDPAHLGRQVREFAIIPRYFQICVRLRERLASLEILSLPVLLWEDLRDKLERGDPQIHDLGQKLHFNPDEILAHLARNAGWSQETIPTITVEQVQAVLPGIQSAITDLVEQRIVVDRNADGVALSRDHVVLGWGLVLRHAASARADMDVDSLCDRLRQLMEPASTNDAKAAALHAAMLLTFLDTATGGAEFRGARTALLALWITCHNARASDGALRFFAGADLASYCATVENLFRQHLPGHLETKLIAPLAGIWRLCDDRADALREVLQRWLRLIYPGDASGSENGTEAPPPRLVPAATSEQLRLSYAAIGIISFRPENRLLPALVDCTLSADFCYRDVEGRDPPRRSPVKLPLEPVGVLLRWHYAEDSLPELARIAAELRSGCREAEALLWFARLFRMAEIPAVLGSAEDIRDWRDRTASQPVHELEVWLTKPQERKGYLVGLGLLRHLAIRRDVPELSAEAAGALCDEIRKLLLRADAAAITPGTWQWGQFRDLLPWLARHDPKAFCAACCRACLKALNTAGSAGELTCFTSFLPADDPSRELARAVVDWVSRPDRRKGSGIDLVPGTELVLMHGSEGEIVEWFEIIQGAWMPGGGHVIDVLPLPWLLGQRATPSFAAAALGQFERYRAELAAGSAASTVSKSMAFWLAVYADVVEPTLDVCEWALRLAEEYSGHEGLGWPLFKLACQHPEFEGYRRALFHPFFREQQSGRNVWMWARRFGDQAWQFLSLKELRGRVSLSVAGELLCHVGKDAELRAWGRDLAASAMSTVNSPPPEDLLGSSLTFSVDSCGHFQGIGFADLPRGGQTWHGLSSPVWGVDREIQTPEPHQSDHDRAFEQYRHDLEVLRKTARDELIRFNAADALLRWGRLEPGAFVPFAEAFLEKYFGGDFSLLLDLAYFAKAVFVTLLRVSPDRTLARFPNIECVCPGQVRVLGTGLDWEVSVLWSKELNSFREVGETRRKLLEAAANDEVVLWHVLAAHLGGNASLICDFARKFTAEKRARDRALGVTLLAFQGDGESLEFLEQTRAGDSSFWVREHAAWAREACATELVCKTRYRQILVSQSVQQLVAGLAELLPALSPLAYAWHPQIEKEEPWEAPERRMCAHHHLFWFHWSHTSRSRENIETAGRKLREFCRGEALKEGITGRMAPWWVI